MQELINTLKEKAGLTDEQAVTAIETIKTFIKEKVPMFSGAVDNFFKDMSKKDEPAEDDFV